MANLSSRNFVAMRVLSSLRSFPIARMACAAQLRLLSPQTRHVMRARPGCPDLQARAFNSSAPAAADEQQVPKVYTNFCVYKTKGAVAVKVIKPTFIRLSPPGANISNVAISREGTLLLEFANAVGERQYDWERKGTFALSALECAEVLDTLESGRERSFFHDPSKGSSGEGQVTKSLKITPAQQQGTFYLNLAVREKGNKDSLYNCGLSAAESRVIRSILDFVIPRLMGFDEVFTTPPVTIWKEEGSEGSNSPPF